MLRRLAWRSLVGMGMGDIEVVDVKGGVAVVGHRPRRNYSIATFVSTSAPGRYAYKKFNLPTDGKKIISPEDRFNVTPSRVPVYECPLSAAALREKR